MPANAVCLVLLIHVDPLPSYSVLQPGVFCLAVVFLIQAAGHATGGIKCWFLAKFCIPISKIPWLKIHFC